MKKDIIFEAKEFNNIKEIIYNVAEVYGEKTAFLIKHKENEQTRDEEISYKKLLEDINKL